MECFGVTKDMVLVFGRKELAALQPHYGGNFLACVMALVANNELGTLVFLSFVSGHGL